MDLILGVVIRVLFERFSHGVSDGLCACIVDASFLAGVAHYCKSAKSVVERVNFFFAEAEDLTTVCWCG